MEKCIIFDNGGKTFDRFTILNKETGDLFATSSDPTAPDGFNKFLGNCIHQETFLYGTGWREKKPAKKIIKLAVEGLINNAKLDPDWLGAEIAIDKIPEKLKQYVNQLGLSNENFSMNSITAEYAPLKKIG